MHSSYAMMASRVTPPTEEKGAKVDGAEEAGGGGVLVYGCFSQSWASLHLMDTPLMAPIILK